MLLVNPQNMHEISESTWISMPNILIILQTCVLWRRNWTLVLSCRKKTYSMQQRNATQWRTPFVERACCLASVCKRVAFQTYQVVIKNAATICKNRKRQIKKHNITSRYWSKKSLVSCSKKASYNAVISETTRRGQNEHARRATAAIGRSVRFAAKHQNCSSARWLRYFPSKKLRFTTFRYIHFVYDWGRSTLRWRLANTLIELLT